MKFFALSDSENQKSSRRGTKVYRLTFYTTSNITLYLEQGSFVGIVIRDYERFPYGSYKLEKKGK